MEEKQKMTKERIEELFEKGILVNQDMLEKGVDEGLLDKVETEQDLVVLNDDYANMISQQTSLVNWYDIDKYRVDAEKDRDEELYQSHLQDIQKTTLQVEKPGEILADKEEAVDAPTLQPQTYASLETALGIEVGQASNFSTESELQQHEDEKFTASTSKLSEQELAVADYGVTVVEVHENKPKKYEIKDFTNFFLSRYYYLEKMLRGRQELQNTTTINRLQGKREREQVSVIGIVEDIAETKNGNLIITLEDPTGSIKILVSKSKKELFMEGKDLVVDEVIGVSGVSGDKIIFADTLVWPDIPRSNVLKKGPEEEYAVFLSDVHVGSTLFLHDEFMKFVQWINGQTGTEKQRSVALKVKYVFIAGDLVDGVGIYPSQEEELNIPDIKGQYEEFARLIGLIRKDIGIIICPGNHDAVHLAEPQSVFAQEFAGPLFEMENVTLVTNPSIVNVGKTEQFLGFDVLLYHGYSFDYYVSNVESIRQGGGYHRSDLIMKFLLKRRHLAPSFKSTPYYPAHKEDPLLIKQVPDFFITGHIHYCSVANYKGVTMISGSCWQAKTDFQEKLGHEPEPARVPVVNLKTREIKILRFG